MEIWAQCWQNNPPDPPGQGLISALPAELPFGATSCAFLVKQDKAVLVQPQWRKQATDLHCFP